MTDNPYKVKPAALVGPGSDFSEATVTIYPHDDGCAARIVVCGETYEVGETQDLYGELWLLIDRISGELKCQEGVPYCGKPLYESGEFACPAHKGEEL